jgi:RRXRR protein
MQVHTCPDPARTVFGLLSGYDIGKVQERTKRYVPVSCSITALVKQADGVKPVLRRSTDRYHRQGKHYLRKGRLIMSNVFVLDTNYKQLNPVHQGRARILLDQGRAAVYKRFPFTIILKVAVDQPQLDALRLKIDPGSKTTGLAVVNDVSGEVVFAANLSHRGEKIKKRLDDRRAVRRNRRNRKTRYRAPRFDNRKRGIGWLPPSLESRVANVLTWVNRLRRFCPIFAISLELVKCDLQKMENPEITGVLYQHINKKYCRILQRADGYGYTYEKGSAESRVDKLRPNPK